MNVHKYKTSHIIHFSLKVNTRRKCLKQKELSLIIQEAYKKKIDFFASTTKLKNVKDFCLANDT